MAIKMTLPRSKPVRWANDLDFRYHLLTLSLGMLPECISKEVYYVNIMYPEIWTSN